MKSKNKNKVLIVGGGGYIGNIVSNFLKKKKFDVTNLDCFIYGQKKKFKSKNTEYQKINIIDLKKLDKKWENFKIIIFLSGLVGDPITKKYPKLSNKINEITKKFISYCNKKKIDQFIFVSTCSNMDFQNLIKD